MTLRQQLKGNPFQDMFISIIGSLHGRYVQEEDKVRAAQMITLRLDSWSGVMAFITAPRESRALYNYTPKNRVFSTGLPVRGQRTIASKLATFEQDLKGMSMDGVNNYAHFIQCVDAFYSSVSFLNHFATAKDGEDLQYVMDSVGLFSREGSKLQGLTMAINQRGSDGLATSQTLITPSGGDIGNAGKYFSMYASSTVLNVYWLTVDATGTAPSLTAINGVTINYIEIALLSTDNLIVNGSKVIAAVNLEATMNAVTALEGQLIISTLTDISVPESPQQDTPSLWSISFTTGSDLPLQKELTTIDASVANLTDLAGTYFTGTANALDVYGFWFSVDGLPGLPPAMPGVSIIEEIALCCQDRLSIINQIRSKLSFIRVWEILSYADYTISLEAPIVGAFAPMNAETSGKGVADSAVYGADGLKIVLDVNADAAYADAWNLTKAPYDIDAGLRAQYIKPVDGETIIISQPRSAGICSCGPYQRAYLVGTTTQNPQYAAYYACMQLCEGKTPPAKKIAGVFLKSNKLAVGADLPFNTPVSGYRQRRIDISE